MSRRSSSVAFNLTNILEAKVFEKNDTSGKPKKIKLIDNFGISTSYNVFADSLKWSPISMGLRTTLFDNIGVSANSSFSLYGLSKTGGTIGTFAYAQNKKLMRLTNFSVSLDFDLGRLITGDKEKPGQGAAQGGSPPVTPAGQEDGVSGFQAGQNQASSLYDEYGYYIFDVPWSMRVSYNINYIKPAFKSSLNSDTFSKRNM